MPLIKNVHVIAPSTSLPPVKMEGKLDCQFIPYYMTHTRTLKKKMKINRKVTELKFSDAIFKIFFTRIIYPQVKR